MSARALPELKSADRATFDHYLRTGERFTGDEWVDRLEAKFNPYHDELGRFTTALGAVGPQGEAGFTTAVDKVREWFGASPKKPAPPKPKSSQAPVPTQVSRAAPVSPPVKNLLTQITNGEGVGDVVARRHGYASSYDVPFNYGRFARQTKPLTQMTLKEVDELQTRILNHPENTHKASPVGRYQIVRTTLRELKQRLNLRDDMIFDSNLQDTLGMSRLRRAGLQNSIDGKITESAFQTNIAKEWASVADPKTGRPRRPRQHLGTTTAQVAPLIRALRQK
jgi:hypothetical protein